MTGLHYVFVYVFSEAIIGQQLSYLNIMRVSVRKTIRLRRTTSSLCLAVYQITALRGGLTSHPLL